MRIRSLYSHLLLWLLAPLAVIVAAYTLATYASVQETARLVQERLLLGSARVMGEQLASAPNELNPGIPPSALELLDTGMGDRAWYRVTNAAGMLIAGSADLPGPGRSIAAERWHAYDARIDGNDVYVVAFSQPEFGSSQASTVLVEVAQTLRERKALVNRLWLREIRNEILMLLLGVALVWIGLQRGIAPLKVLRDKMQNRDQLSLEPGETDTVPTELHPLITTMNEYIARLRQHMLAHSRFIADASHQLRTPLAVMNTQVAYGLRETGIEAKDETLIALRSSLRSNIRLVNQLLSYTEAEGGKPNLRSGDPADMVEVIRHVVEELAMLAQSKDIDLGVESDGTDHLVALCAHALHVLIANLVDNALRYTQVGGRVTVTIGHDPDGEYVDVCDNGPGIPSDMRERVFERFVRLHNKEIDGCGLGLAIVREIAIGCAARLSMHDADGGGLRVRVHFVRDTDTPSRQAKH